jgi:hypothetical protein
MKAKIIFLFLFLLFGTWSCGGYIYQKPDGVDVQRWHQDTEKCWDLAYKKALEIVGNGSSPDYKRTFDSFYDPCMESHGYYKSWTWGMVK